MSSRVPGEFPSAVAAGAQVLAAPTALETVTLFRSFAGVSCRHRRLLPAFESQRDALLDSLHGLRFSDLQRLVVACGQLRAAPELARIAISSLATRDATMWSSLTLVQTVHAAVRLSLLPAPSDRFWCIWAWCRDNALTSVWGRNEVTTFAAAVALQRWDCAKMLAKRASRIWPDCSLDFSMWIGNLAALLGLRGGPARLWQLGTELFTEACAVYCGGAGGCFIATSEARQMLTFALVRRNFWPGHFALGPGLSELLDVFQADGSKKRRSKSRLQEEVVQTLLIVLHTDGSPPGAWRANRPRIVLEEPCLVYDLDIYVR